MMHKNYLFITTAAMMMLTSCSSDNSVAPTELVQRLDSLVEHEHRLSRFNGTVVIGTNDSILYEKAVGTADRGWGIPMKPEYRFDVCSVAKSFTAALTMMAVDEGRLNLSDRLIDVLAPAREIGHFNPDITVHHLLTHTSGIPHYEALSDNLSKSNFRKFKRMHLTREEYTELISKLESTGDPGKQFHYSSFGYHLLALALEDIYQTSFVRLLDEKICKPLELTNTFSTASNREIHKNIVEAYTYDDSTDVWKRNQFIDLTQGQRIFSTSKDLYLWGKAMSSSSILSDSSRKLMQTNHLNNVDPGVSYGYGWVVGDGKKNYRMGDLDIRRTYLIHGGNTEGYKSMLINIENGQYIIAFLANTGDRTDEMRLATKIVNLLIKSENEN